MLYHLFAINFLLIFTKAHSDCSESFYKKEIVVGIHNEPSRTAQERKQMMEVLKRFEEESAATEEELEGDSDDELTKRLSGIDLGGFLISLLAYAASRLLRHRVGGRYLGYPNT